MAFVPYRLIFPDLHRPVFYLFSLCALWSQGINTVFMSALKSCVSGSLTLLIQHPRASAQGPEARVVGAGVE